MPRYWQSGRVDPARAEPLNAADQPHFELMDPTVNVARMQRQVEQEQATDRMLSEAAYQDLVARGLVTAFERTNFFQMAQALTPPLTIVSFTCPGDAIFRLRAVGFSFSDPIMHQLDSKTYLPWVVEVEGNPIPGFGETNSTTYRISPGDIFAPWQTAPVWIHANQTVAVVLRTLAAVTIQVNVQARISGELLKKSSLRLGREV